MAVLAREEVAGELARLAQRHESGLAQPEDGLRERRHGPRRGASR
jgi:hypothetical protein